MSPKAKRQKTATKSRNSGRKAPASKAARKSAPKRKKADAAGSKAPRKKKATTGNAPSPARKKSTPQKKVAKPQRRKKAARARVKRPRKVRLGPRQVEHFREILLAKQQDLTAAYLISKGNSRSDLDDGTEDYIDYAVHSYAREFLLSLSELERKQLFLVEDALERLGRGEFGHCHQCGEAINPKRLEVAPWARYCVPCQELEEKGLLPELTAAEAMAESESEDDGDEADDELDTAVDS